MKKRTKIILAVFGSLGAVILIISAIMGINQLIVIVKEQGDAIGKKEISGENDAYVGQDWPGWRGPGGDGTTSESGWVYDVDKISLLWEQNIGKGYSAPSVAQGKVYVSGHTQRKDIVYCLDLITGEEIWTYSYTCKPGEYTGPRASPLIHQGFLYTINREGIVYCIDISNGVPRWSVHLARQYNMAPHKWGYSGSAILYNDFIIINAGKAGIALNKKTGELFWQNGIGDGGYASPVLYDDKGKACITFFTGSGLVAAEAETGKILWEYPWVLEPPVNAADPLVIGSKVFISSSYLKGCALIDFSEGTPVTVWVNRNISSHFSSFYHNNGYIYGFDATPMAPFAGEFRCLDINTGNIAWGEKLGFGSFIVSDNKFIILLQPGTIKIAEVNHKKYSELASLKVKRGVFWTAPVLSHGILLLRSSRGALTAVTLRP